MFNDLILHPPLWAIVLALFATGCGLIGAALFALDWVLKRRERFDEFGLPMGSVEAGLESIHGESVTGSGRTYSHTMVPRRATMDELLDSVSWPWRGTPREPDPPAPVSTAIVGEGRGHLLGQ